MNRIVQATTLYLLTADAVRMGKSPHAAIKRKGAQLARKTVQLRKPAILSKTKRKGAQLKAKGHHLKLRQEGDGSSPDLEQRVSDLEDWIWGDWEDYGDEWYEDDYGWEDEGSWEDDWAPSPWYDSCFDTDYDTAGDSFGDSCAWYVEDWCTGEWDTDEFVAANMCCACGGGESFDMEEAIEEAIEEADV